MNPASARKALHRGVRDRQVAEEHEARSAPAQALRDLPVLVRNLDATQGFGNMRRGVFGHRLRDPGERRDHAVGGTMSFCAIP